MCLSQSLSGDERVLEKKYSCEFGCLSFGKPNKPNDLLLPADIKGLIFIEPVTRNTWHHHLVRKQNFPRN